MVQLLDVVPERARPALLAQMQRRRYKAATVVFNQGDPGNTLYVVESGRFDVRATTVNGQIRLLRVVHPGEIFGELAVVHPYATRTARVCALEDSTALLLSRAAFNALRDEYPEVDRLLVAALAERIHRSNELLVEMLLPPEERIWRRLAMFAEAYGDAPIRMSQDVLAQAAGTVRQTANRVLQQGARDGVLALDRGEIRVLDRDALRRLASG
jgi:CRP-like cAMP-binding protein